MELGTLLLIGLALIVFFRYFVRIDRKPNPTQAAPAPMPAPAPRQAPGPARGIHTWDSTGNFDFDIVGESNYQGALKTLAGDQQDRDREYTALLIPEDNNRYDKNAIRVEIDGHTVGYLGRDDAPRFKRRLGAKKLTGQTTRCSAVLTGGYTMKNGQQASRGVKLDIKPFD